ncbi:hypothetical protein TSMEX_004453, partial [Taenia solium]
FKVFSHVSFCFDGWRDAFFRVANCRHRRVKTLNSTTENEDKRTCGVGHQLCSLQVCKGHVYTPMLKCDLVITAPRWIFFKSAESLRICGVVAFSFMSSWTGRLYVDGRSCQIANVFTSERRLMLLLIEGGIAFPHSSFVCVDLKCRQVGFLYFLALDYAIDWIYPFLQSAMSLIFVYG